MRKVVLCRSSLCNFAITACINAAKRDRCHRRAIARRKSRNSKVSKNGCSRMSHQIFCALSTQPVGDEQLQVIFVPDKAFEGVRNAGAWKALEDLQAIALNAGVFA